MDKRSLLSVVTALVIVAAACGGGGDSTDDPPGTTSAAPTTTAPSTSAPGSTEPLAGPVLRGDPAPDLPFEYFDSGETGTLADFRGTPAVVNFWASWCPACIAEMPDFEAVSARLGDAVTFVGIDIQDVRAEALRLAEETGVNYTLVEDPNGAIYTEIGGFAMPTTLFVNELGEIVEQHNGVIFEADLEAKIREVLLP